MKNKRIMWYICAIFTLVLGIAVFSVYAAEPGSGDDPIVTKSYIEMVRTEIKEYVDEKLALLPNSQDKTSTAGSNQTYKVVRLADGQKISFSEGAEFILRMGQGEIFSTEKGGIADVTEGTDLQDGTKLPVNHLMIVPVADGRGFTASGDVLVMVRGEYTIR